MRQRISAILGALAVVGALGAGARAQEKASAVTWEFRAVVFGDDEDASTRKLNDLAADGWEYVGPLRNGLVAFKRRALKDELAGAFTISVKMPRADEPIVRRYSVREPFSVRGGAYTLVKKYPWGTVRAEGKLGKEGKLTLRWLAVEVKQDWGAVRGEVVRLTTRRDDLLNPRAAPRVELTADGVKVPLYFDKGGLGKAAVTVRGSLSARGPGR
jgi:hypothetical protein